MLVLSWSSDRRASSLRCWAGAASGRQGKGQALHRAPRAGGLGTVLPILSPASSEDRKAGAHGLKFKMVVQPQADVRVLSTLQGGAAER